jgi:hypothetical protein
MSMRCEETIAAGSKRRSRVATPTAPGRVIVAWASVPAATARAKEVKTTTRSGRGGSPAEPAKSRLPGTPHPPASARRRYASAVAAIRQPVRESRANGVRRST